MTNWSHILEDLTIRKVTHSCGYSSTTVQVTAQHDVILWKQEWNPLHSILKNFKHWQEETWAWKLRCHLSTLLLILGNSPSVLLNMLHKSSANNGVLRGAFLSEMADKIIFKIMWKFINFVIANTSNFITSIAHNILKCKANSCSFLYLCWRPTYCTRFEILDGKWEKQPFNSSYGSTIWMEMIATISKSTRIQSGFRFVRYFLVLIASTCWLVSSVV